MKIVYLSGPISDIVGGNFQEFAAAQEKIEAMGYRVMNPHEICRFVDPKMYLTKEEYWEACMRVCLQQLPLAHKLVTLKDWELSKGAKIEVDIARATGFIEVHHIMTFLNPKANATA